MEPIGATLLSLLEVEARDLPMSLHPYSCASVSTPFDITFENGDFASLESLGSSWTITTAHFCARVRALYSLRRCDSKSPPSAKGHRTMTPSNSRFFA